MAKIRVRYLPGLMHLIGEKSLEIELSGSRLRDLLAELIKRYGEEFEHAVFDRQHDRLNRTIIAQVNGKYVTDLDYELEEGDKVILGPLISGG